MNILKFPKRTANEPPFFSDIREEGYHIYSIKNAKKPGFYPPEFPDYPGVALKDLKEDDSIIIRVFFGIGTGKNLRVDGGYVDFKIELIESNTLLGSIITNLPRDFSLSTGESLEIYQEEILYKSESLNLHLPERFPYRSFPWLFLWHAALLYPPLEHAEYNLMGW